MSLELIKTTMEDILENIELNVQPLYVCVDEWWQGGRRQRFRHEVCCEVFDKMIVPYITGKTRKIQRWWRSFKELPMACPCPE